MSRKKKKCSTCKSNLIAVTNYNKDKRNKDGYRYDCKLCQYKAQHRHLGKKIKIMEERRERTRRQG